MDKTIRTFIRHRVWRLSALAVGGWLLFPLSAAIYRGHPPPVAAIIGAVMFGCAIVLLQFSVKCPRCSRRLGQTIAMPVAFSGKNNAPNFCPYCAANLDDPMPGASTPGENVTTPDKLVWK